MKFVVTCMLLTVLYSATLYAQHRVFLQNEKNKNFMKFEFDFNGKLYSKMVGESWTLEKINNKVDIVGTQKNIKPIEITFLKGLTYYSLDRYKWHQKSYVVINHETNRDNAIVFAQFDEREQALDIGCTLTNESNVNFYLMFVTGSKSVELGERLLQTGYNKVRFNLDNIEIGNYFLIMVNRSGTLISKVSIF